MTIPHWRAVASNTALQARHLIAKDLRNDLRHWARGSGSKDLLAPDTNEANVRCLLSNQCSDLLDLFIRDPSSEIDHCGDPSFSDRSAGVATQS